MRNAYDESYLEDARDRLGNMLDYAVHDLKYTLDEFWAMFLKSRVSRKMEAGDVTTLVGGSGIELAWNVLEDNLAEDNEMFIEKYMQMELPYRPGRSREYWTGWAVAYYQWKSGNSFLQIDRAVPIMWIEEMYDKYHEMDEEHFCQRIYELQTNTY